MGPQPCPERLWEEVAGVGAGQESRLTSHQALKEMGGTLRRLFWGSRLVLHPWHSWGYVGLTSH